MIQHRNEPARARREFPLRLAALGLCLAILGGGCVWNPVASLPGPRLSGTITLTGTSRDAAGNVAGVLAVPRVTGVRLRALNWEGLQDSSKSLNGSFSVLAGIGLARLVVGPSVATSDTLGPWSVGNTGIPGLFVRLSGKGTLVAYPNPVQPGARVTIILGAAQPERVVVRIRDLEGTVVRTLVDRVLVAGTFAVAWDTRDDANKRVPIGTYWATCEGGAAAAGVPSPGPHPVTPPTPITDSIGSRELVVVTAR